MPAAVNAIYNSQARKTNFKSKRPYLSHKYFSYATFFIENSSIKQGYLALLPAQSKKKKKKKKKRCTRKKFHLFLEIKLSSSNIKKIIFSQKKTLYVHFSAQALQVKEIHLRKISYTSGNGSP